MLGQRLLRGASFGVLVLASFFAVSTANVGGTAYALAVPPLPVGLPFGLGGGVAAGAGEVVGVAGTSAEVAAGGVGLAAVAPAAAVAAGVLAVGGAVYLGIRYVTGHDPAMYDPPAQATGTGTSWSYPSPIQYPSSGSVSYVSGTIYSYSLTYVSSSDQYSAVLFYTACGGTLMGQLSSASKSSPGTATGSLNLSVPSCSGGGHPQLAVGHYPLWNTSGLKFFDPAWTQGMYPATGQTTVTTTPVSQCSGGGSVTGSAVTYTGSTTSLPVLSIPACPSGQTRTGLTFGSTGYGGATATSPLGSWSAPTIPSAFPECQTTGTSCVLVLYRVGFGAGAQSVACSTGNCVGWAAQTTQSGTARNVLTSAGASTTERPFTYPNGDHLDCYWGSYLMTTHSCDTYPTESGSSTSTATCVAGTMACAPSSDTTTDTNKDGSSCSGSWSWNPVDWVENPVKCALRWAFVPSDGALQADMATVQSGWAGNGVTTWASAFAAVPTALVTLGTNAAGCSGPHFTITLEHHAYAFDPLNACTEPMATVATVVKLFATIALIVFGGRRLARMVLSSIGMNSAV